MINSQVLTMEMPERALKPVITLQLAMLLVMAFFAFAPKASAQDVVTHQVVEEVELNKSELSELLAPIALYPDALLSQILVASTYPLEIVQASRWRANNAYLSEDEVIKAVADMDWDPSVKALAPYEDLLSRVTDDLDWLQSLGDAFLSNEDLVLESVQDLRQAARQNGSIADNDYYEVLEDDSNIIIESTQREIVYVPYYDTRVVYGSSYWSGYHPVYWDRPLGYTHLHGGFYWSSRSYIRPSVFFGGFHWGTRNLVVDSFYYDRPYTSSFYSFPSYYSSTFGSRYSIWNHNPIHRRGVRYPQQVLKSYGSSFTNLNSRNSSSIVNRGISTSIANQVIQRNRNTSVSTTQQRLNNLRNQNTRTTNTSRVVTSRSQPVQRQTATQQSTPSRQAGNTSRVLNRQPAAVNNSTVSRQQSTNRSSATRPTTSRNVSATQRRTTSTATSQSSSSTSSAAKATTGNNPLTSRTRQRLQVQ